MPAERGNGLAMRAGLLLEALAADCDVHLLVVPVAGPAPDWPRFVVDRTVERVCLHARAPTEDVRAGARPGADRSSHAAALRSLLLPTLARAATGEHVEEARRRLGGDSTFDVVVVMRLYLAPFIAAFSRRYLTVVDLDDDEVVTRRRLAALHVRLGRTERSDAEAAEADKYRVLEAAWLPLVDRVLVCSTHDRDAVAARTGHPSVQVVPNGVRWPEPGARRGRRREDAAGHLVFVGSLGYFPNVDAAVVLCREVLPALRQRTGRAVTVDLVGSRPASEVTDLGRIEGVAIHADVADLAPFYRRADIAVVPIRAGGGTRVKILEAFAHRVPVVSTAVGAEGLHVTAGRHLLIAEAPDEIAAACHQLLLDSALAQRIETEAADLVAAEYEASVVTGGLRALLRDGLAGPLDRAPRGAR